MAGAGVFAKIPGDVIYLADYNAIQSLIASVKTSFYGIPTVSSQHDPLLSPWVVTADDWNQLRIDISDCIKHQTGTPTTILNRVVGEPIRATDSNEHHASSVIADTNKIDVYAPTQLALVANTAVSNRNGAISPWNTTIRHTSRVNFASDNDTTYFFNCGGYFTINLVSSGGNSSLKDNAWRAMISAVGTRALTRSLWLSMNIGDTIILQKIGYNHIHTPDSFPVYTSYIHAYANAAYAYSHSTIKITATKDSNSQITFNVILNDAGPDHQVDENIALNITSSLSYYKSVDAIVSAIPSAIGTIVNL